MKRRPRILSKVEAFTEDTIAMVDWRYGSGFPNFTAGNKKTPAYHNGYHTRRVTTDVGKLARHFGFDAKLTAVVRSAGAIHDFIKEYGPGVDEENSSWLLREGLKYCGVDWKHIKIGCTAVKGTEPRLGEWSVLGQKAFEVDYESAEEKQASELLATADLGALYAPDGPLLGHMVLKEAVEDPEWNMLRKFQVCQTSFLEDYKYPHVRAGKLLSTHRPEVIAHSVSLVDELEAGNIGSFEEVIARDLEFYNAHA